MVSEGTVGASATPDRGVARALVRAVRPRQWVKNLLVVAAPLAAGELGDSDVLGGHAAGLRQLLPRGQCGLPRQRRRRP